MGRSKDDGITVCGYLSKYPACSISLPQVPSLVSLYAVSGTSISPQYLQCMCLYVDGLQLWV